MKKHWYKVGLQPKSLWHRAQCHQDMHYAEFAPDEVSKSLGSRISPAYRLLQEVALREAIREYDANKWKVIGQKVGKPAKVWLAGNHEYHLKADEHQACEQHAKEHKYI